MVSGKEGYRGQTMTLVGTPARKMYAVPSRFDTCLSIHMITDQTSLGLLANVGIKEKTNYPSNQLVECLIVFLDEPPSFAKSHAERWHKSSIGK